MLSLVSDSASLSSLSEEPFAPLQIFAIHDLLHRWGEFLVLSAPPPNPVLAYSSVLFELYLFHWLIPAFGDDFKSFLLVLQILHDSKELVVVLN